MSLPAGENSGKKDSCATATAISAIPANNIGLRSPIASATHPISGQPNAHPSGTKDVAQHGGSVRKMSVRLEKATPQVIAPIVVGDKKKP